MHLSSQARSHRSLPVCDWRLLGRSHWCFSVFFRIPMYFCLVLRLFDPENRSIFVKRVESILWLFDVWRFVDLQTQSPSESLRSSKLFMCFSIVYLAYWTVASVWAQLCWSGHLPEALQVGKCQRRLTSCFWYLIGLWVNRRAYCKWSACNSEGFCQADKVIEAALRFCESFGCKQAGSFSAPQGTGQCCVQGWGHCGSKTRHKCILL